MGTESLLAFGTASQVGLTRVEGDVSIPLNQFVHTGMIPTMTGTGRFGSAVQDPLNAEVNIVALSLTSDLDTISQGRDCAVSPAGSTVVRDVLVEMLGEVGFAIDVVPVPVVGDVFLEEVAG